MFSIFLWSLAFHIAYIIAFVATWMTSNLSYLKQKMSKALVTKMFKSDIVKYKIIQKISNHFRKGIILFLYRHFVVYNKNIVKPEGN